MTLDGVEGYLCSAGLIKRNSTNIYRVFVIFSPPQTPLDLRGVLLRERRAREEIEGKRME